MRFVTEPVLFFSPPLFLPHSMSPLVGGGAGAWGLLQTFACAACLSFYSDSKKRIRTSYQSKSCLQWNADRGNTTARRQTTDNGMSLSKCVILMKFTKGRITTPYTLNAALVIVIQLIVTEYHIIWICIQWNIKLQPLIGSLLSVLLIWVKGLCNEPITHDHVLTLYKKEN